MSWYSYSSGLGGASHPLQCALNHVFWLLPLLYQPLLLVTLCFSELLGGLSRSSKLNACVLLFKLSHPCCSKSCLQRKTSWYFSLKYHLPGSLLIEKVICAGRFLWLVLCKWIQIIFLLDCCQRLCFSLKLWLGFLFHLLVVQITFVNLFQISEVYQQLIFAGFAGFLLGCGYTDFCCESWGKL